MRKGEKVTTTYDKEKLSYEETRNKTTQHIENVYGCKKECLDAQLDDYYKKVHTCKGDLKNSEIQAHNGYGTGVPKTEEVTTVEKITKVKTNTDLE